MVASFSLQGQSQLQKKKNKKTVIALKLWARLEISGVKMFSQLSPNKRGRLMTIRVTGNIRDIEEFEDNFNIFS